MDNNFTKNKKHGFHFNCIDVLILIAVAAIICAFVFRAPSYVSDADASEISPAKINTIVYNKNVEYIMKVSSLQQASGNLIKVGDVLYSYETSAPIGTVTDVRVDPAELYVSLPTGEIVKRNTPNRVDIYLTIKAPAHIDKTGHYLEGYIFVCANKEFYCYTPNLNFVGVVQTVNEVNEDLISEEKNQEIVPEEGME